MSPSSHATSRRLSLPLSRSKEGDTHLGAGFAAATRLRRSSELTHEGTDELQAERLTDAGRDTRGQANAVVGNAKRQLWVTPLTQVT